VDDASALVDVDPGHRRAQQTNGRGVLPRESPTTHHERLDRGRRHGVKEPFEQLGELLVPYLPRQVMLVVFVEAQFPSQRPAVVLVARSELNDRKAGKGLPIEVCHAAQPTAIRAGRDADRSTRPPADISPSIVRAVARPAGDQAAVRETTSIAQGR
jgi:hypothetical protein